MHRVLEQDRVVLELDVAAGRSGRAFRAGPGHQEQRLVLLPLKSAAQVGRVKQSRRV